MKLTSPFALALVASTAAAQRGGPPAPPVPFMIRDVTVIDGTGAVPRPHMDIVVREGQIVVLAPTGTARATLPDSVIDGRGLFVIPGLIDSHVHIGTGSWESRVAMLKGAINGGVTTVLDMADDTRSVGEMQRAVFTGQIAGPKIHYIALMGGPTFFSDPRTVESSRGYTSGTAPWMQSIVDSTNMALAIARARGTGAFAIKLYAALDSTMVTRATAEAHRQGMKVFAHATTFPGLPGDLVSAGADMLAHAPYLVWQGSPRTTDFPARARGDFLGVPAAGPVMERLLTQMRDRGTALNPTFFVFDGPRPDSVANVRGPWMYAVTRRAAQLGVRIVAGTDGLFNASRDSMPGIHRELELMVTNAGFTPVEAIASATREGAWAVGASAKLGTIAINMTADLVLLGGDPTVDIRNTRAVRVVIQDGKVVRR